jgi:lysophospholipase L1-like esterase
MKGRTFADVLIGASISLVTIFLMLFAVEFSLRYSHRPAYRWDYRLTFLSAGEVYQNKSWGGFLYAPNARIHLLTYYIANPPDPTLVKEFEYEIATNSYGLVQRNDIDSSKLAILLLGDSFTEGQGASPWFYDFESRWPYSRYQVINGGIQGTGVEAWAKLHEEILKAAPVEKLVVIFISDDWTRFLWKLPPQNLNCLRDPRQCNGADPFLGLPHDSAAADQQIQRIAKARIDYLKNRASSTNLIESSEIYKQLLHPAYDLWHQPNRSKVEQNERAALQIVTRQGPENVLFIHVPQKDELVSGPNIIGKQADDFIRSHGWPFVDGFEQCSLTIGDFHPNDGHPNADGYSKLENCIANSVKIAFRLKED